MGRRIVTKDEQLIVVELARQGLVRSEITGRTGLSRDIINAVCRKFCVKITEAKRGKKKDLLRIRAVALVVELLGNQQEAARRLGVSQFTIWRDLRDARELQPTDPQAIHHQDTKNTKDFQSAKT